MPTDAHPPGFTPEASGTANAQALQRALDAGGTVQVRVPGTYRIARTVLIGSHTALRLADGVILQKVVESTPFTHVLLNRGALTGVPDEHITIEGLHIQANGVDVRHTEVYGLRGQLAIFRARHVRVERFRCLDLGRWQFAFHACNFEDLHINDVEIRGLKDGIHLGRGRSFTIRNALFQTFDDAIALNAHDYATSNPELGWIEDGLVENCRDLDADTTTGYFCRILAGAWRDWQPGAAVQHSDTVVHQGRVYRVHMEPDGRVFTSHTPPTHTHGSAVLDGIRWGLVQTDGAHTAGVRRVKFRNISLEKPRIAFSLHFDDDAYSRSYAPGAELPVQRDLAFEDVRVEYGAECDLIAIDTPVDALSLTRVHLRHNAIRFRAHRHISNPPPTRITMRECSFAHPGPMALVRNEAANKEIHLHTTSSIELSPAFRASISPGPGRITWSSDLTGLNQGQGKGNGHG